MRYTLALPTSARRKKSAGRRAPEEERRTSAVLYLKHAPKSREPTTEELRKSITKDMFTTLFAPEIAVHQKAVTEQRERADKQERRAEKAEADLRELKEAIRAARTASEKVSKLVDGEQKTEPRNRGTPFADQYMADLFNNVKSPGYKW
jgi:hypothetical protein